MESNVAAAEAAAPVDVLGLAPTTEAPTPEAPATTEAPKDVAAAEAAPESILGEAPKDEAKAPTEEAKPIEYTDFTLPEGVTPKPEEMVAFKEYAAANKLSQEQAQAGLDMYVQGLQHFVTEQQRQWQDQQKIWQKEIVSDPEIGGNNLAGMKATVAKALDQYGAPGTREALFLTGAGNHPAIVKTFYTMAKALVEGGMAPTGNPPGAQRSPGQIMYPNLPE